jgi:hypothetical protein
MRDEIRDLKAADQTKKASYDDQEPIQSNEKHYDEEAQDNTPPAEEELHRGVPFESSMRWVKMGILILEYGANYLRPIAKKTWEAVMSKPWTDNEECGRELLSLWKGNCPKFLQEKLLPGKMNEWDVTILTGFIRNLYKEDFSRHEKKRKLNWNRENFVKCSSKHLSEDLASFFEKTIDSSEPGYQAPGEIMRCENLRFMRNWLVHRSALSLQVEEFEQNWKLARKILSELTSDNVDVVCENILGLTDTKLKESKKKIEDILATFVEETSKKIKRCENAHATQK